MSQPFVHEGELYLSGNRFGRKDIIISRSSDEGNSCSPMITLFQGDFWNAPTSIAVANGQIYRAFDFGGTSGGRPLSVVAGDLSQDLLDPKTWRQSNILPYPGTPAGLRRAEYPKSVLPYQFYDHWLEPNVIDVAERLMVLARARIAVYATAGMCGLCNLTDDGKKLHLEFAQFYTLARRTE